MALVKNLKQGTTRQILTILFIRILNQIDRIHSFLLSLIFLQFHDTAPRWALLYLHNYVNRHVYSLRLGL